MQRIENDVLAEEREHKKKQELKQALNDNLKVQIQQKEYLKALDKQIAKIPSVKTSAFYGMPDDEKLKNRLEAMRETTEDLTIQMQLKTLIKEQAREERIDRERTEQAFIQQAIEQDEIDKRAKKAEVAS